MNYEKIDSRLSIEIVSILLAEPEMLANCLTRVARFAHNAVKASITCQERVPEDAAPYKNPGWLEYLIYLQFRDGGKLTIGAIQRTLGAATEFHS